MTISQVMRPPVEYDELNYLALELMLIAFAGRTTPAKFKLVPPMLAVPRDRELQLTHCIGADYPFPITTCSVPREADYELVHRMQRILRLISAATREEPLPCILFEATHSQIMTVRRMLMQYYPWHMLELQVAEWRRQVTHGPTSIKTLVAAGHQVDHQ